MVKENFGQAMNELFGVGKANGKTEEKPKKLPQRPKML